MTEPTGRMQQRSGTSYQGSITWDRCDLLTEPEELDQRRPDFEDSRTLSL